MVKMMSPNEEEKQQDEEHQENNDLYFHSTQMQSIHEETLAEESHADVIRKSISRLNSFKHENTDDTESSISISIPISIQKPIRKIPKTTSKRKLKVSKPQTTKVNSKDKNKIKSSSESVRRMYESRNNNSDQQGSIDGFLKDKSGKLDEDTNRSSKLFSQSEWESIMKIHEKSTKKDMILRKRIHEYSHDVLKCNDGEGEQEQDRCKSWALATSSNPETKLTKEELKCLYDLDSSTVLNQTTLTNDDDDEEGEEKDIDQDSFPYVFTLSQKQKSDDDILDQDPEVLEPTQEIFSTPPQEIFSTPPLDHRGLPVNEDPEKDQTDPSIIILEENQISTQPDKNNDEIEEIISDSEPEPEPEYVFNKIQVFRSIDDHSTYIPKPPTTSKQSSVFSEVVENDSIPIISPVKTNPHEIKMNIIQVPSSEPPSPVKGYIQGLDHQEQQPQQSQPQPRNEEVFTDVESIYSTARTSFESPKHTSPIVLLMSSDDEENEIETDVDGDVDGDIPVSSMPTVKTIPKKRMRTTILQISAALKIQNYTDEKNNIKLRKIGEDIPKKNLLDDIDIDDDDDIEVIPDSQESMNGDGDGDGDNSVSIIEITREVRHDDYSGDESTDIFLVGLNKRDELVDEISSPLIQIGCCGDGGGTENDILDSSLIKPDDDDDDDEEEDQEDLWDISKLSVTQLREKFTLWGLKPVRGKDKMVEILQGISNFISPEQQLIDIDNKEKLQSCIFKKLDNIIRQDLVWYDRLISFEPIRLEEFQEKLQSQEHYLELDVLRSYCDNSGITTTNM